uniref:Uncharacterized protein n=1 Tax=Mammaliicoccus phage MSShimriz1 TaxID=3230127 RepID=A0AAU8GS64_9VIRU
MNMLEHISRQEHVLEQVQADLQAFHKLEQKRNKKLLKKLLTVSKISCNIIIKK